MIIEVIAVLVLIGVGCVLGIKSNTVIADIEAKEATVVADVKTDLKADVDKL